MPRMCNAEMTVMSGLYLSLEHHSAFHAIHIRMYSKHIALNLMLLLSNGTIVVLQEKANL
jgi:hypothetical protein